MIRTGVVLLWALSCTLSNGDDDGSPQGESPAPTVLVGDRSVKGRNLSAFDNAWSSGNGAVITEVANKERQGRDQMLVRNQVWPMQQGLELHSELKLDADTLATISFEQEIVGLPEGASLGATPTLLRWVFDGASYTRTVVREGEEEITQGTLAEPMFEGSGLGLVIAALPLEEGFEARVPVAMSLNVSPALTLYWAHLRVTGKEAIPWKKNKTVDAWIVEVDWVDYETGEVTSKGGASESGGAYFVVTKPPRGFPHVARYTNDGGSIELVVEE